MTRGVIGCPVCGAEFRIVEGLVLFGEPGSPGGHRHSPDYDAAALLAFVELTGPGGYACLVGAAARHALALAELMPGVHVVAVNPPEGVAPSSRVSVLRASASLPLKSGQLRAVVLGADRASPEWLAEGVRVLLPGLRLVVEDEEARPSGVGELARGAGLLVARKER